MNVIYFVFYLCLSIVLWSNKRPISVSCRELNSPCGRLGKHGLRKSRTLANCQMFLLFHSYLFCFWYALIVFIIFNCLTKRRHFGRHFEKLKWCLAAWQQRFRRSFKTSLSMKYTIVLDQSDLDHALKSTYIFSSPSILLLFLCLLSLIQ